MTGKAPAFDFHGKSKRGTCSPGPHTSIEIDSIQIELFFQTRKNKMLKIGVSVMGLMIGTILPATVWSKSDCWIRYETSTAVYTKPAVSTIPAVSPPSFSPSVPVGTVLIRESLKSTSPLFLLRCDNGLINTHYTRSGAQGTFNTWPTGIDGIGVRMKWMGGGGKDVWWPISFELGTLKEASYGGDRELVIEFVKTGPITAGGKITGEIGGAWARNDEFQYMSFQVAGGGIAITPRVPTCKVRQTSINVPLGNVSANLTMPNIGDTSDAKPFKIVLDCDGGEEGSITKTFMTLTDVNDSANMGDTLTLSPESTAKGVGVQILNDSGVVSYGPDSSATGNTNQFSTGTTKNGVLEIPLSARYVRTGTLIGGTVNARASFTMSYQ
ncbi:fimbrial protein [Burkholderia sp. AU15512]|uniref:fimbrial protein n=1 Tax=Burkholderia sp. AU15512 TaxID=2015345 RepID=UPI000B7A88B9|nr:fimbrial protein [Burkholderia sp. AU15512]OXI18975.1 fimbrial protein [Burkholderia sp. AU15512]